MPDIRERVEADRGLLKKIQLLIPGYAGYRRREDIRAADNILRIQLSDRLKAIRGELETIRDDMATSGRAHGLSAIGNAIFTIEGLEGKVRHAEGGYSGLSPMIRIEERELDRLYEYDYAMLEALDRAGTLVGSLREANDAKAFDASLRSFTDAMRAFEGAWKARLAAVTGTQAR